MTKNIYFLLCYFGLTVLTIAQPNDSDYYRYLERQTYEMVLESLTDTVQLNSEFQFHDYQIIVEDTLLIIERKRSAIMISLNDRNKAFHFGELYKRRKHGFTVYSAKNQDAIIIERWRKGALKTRRFLWTQNVE